MTDEQILQDVKILFVDDDPDITESFRLCLEFAGAEVVVGSSAQEAINVCRDWLPDILVSDITMPQLNGYDLIVAMRSSNQGCKDIPAIALSGMANLDKALEQGFTATIQKPVDPDELIQLIWKMLNKGE